MVDLNRFSRAGEIGCYPFLFFSLMVYYKTMHPLEKEVLATAQKEKVFRAHKNVIVGVSAGPDSMALLHILCALTDELGISIIAVYLNHGLRPKEAANEEHLVRLEAERLGIQAHIGSIAVREYAGKHGLSLEHAARQLRYGYLDETAQRENADKIAVGHTADDQAEELLLRLIRGSGRTGLSGMRIIRQGKIVRPLLNTPKKRVIQYLQDRKIPYLVDSSNQDRRYLRNRVRLDLLPFLEKDFNPGVRETLLQTAAILQEEEALLAGLVDKAYRVCVEENKVPGADERLLGIDLILARFHSLPMAIKRRIVEKVLLQMTAKPSFRHIEKVLSLGKAGGGEAILHLALGLRMQKLAGRLVFSYPAGKKGGRGNLTEHRAPDFEIRIERPGRYILEALGKAVHLEIYETRPDISEIAKEKADFLDAENMEFPLVIRSVRPGDRFRPLGGPGSQKVSDFFINNKIPKKERWKAPLLIAGGEIAAILGLRIDHDFRISSLTRRVLKVTVESI